ncbi:MAG: hypothetical protein KatS3mg057_0441 [Herpetosiphonaceae bacterium]|nr:MAG: hypothetical protein KatS3mg057_0441 [Herpetosiphonaceae bacterium]
MRHTFHKQDWTIMLGLGAVIVAGMLAIARAFGEIPASLQSGQHASTHYWAVLAYAYLALPSTAIILLNGIILIIVWTRRHRHKNHRRTTSIAVALSILALLWAGYHTLPQLFISYRHLTSIATGSGRYYLGIREAIDGDSFFMISLCKRGGLKCESYGVSFVEYAERAHLQDIRLDIDAATNTLYIRTPIRSIPIEARIEP